MNIKPGKKPEKSISEKKLAEITKRRKKVLKNLTLISVFVLFASFLWVVLEGYHLLLSKEMVKEADYLVKPLNPEIDAAVINDSQNRRFYGIEQIDSYYQSLSVGPTQTVAEELATESAQLENENE